MSGNGYFSDEDVFNDESGDESENMTDGEAHQSGGKMIGDGVYGCVFMPQLTCKPNTTTTVDAIDGAMKGRRVSKLIDTASASIEFRLSKSISQIPLWRNYFVISESMCTPATRQSEPDLRKCTTLTHEPISSFKLLSMPYRGDSLHLHRFNTNTFDFMQFAKHMIEAGALMNLFNIVHRDLHQGNVLVDAQHVPRIIDFNLSFHAKQQVTASALSHQFEPLIAHEPPDSALVNAIYQQDLYKRDYDRAIQAIMDKKMVLKRIRILFGLSTEGMRQELEDFYHMSKSAKTGDTAGWFRMYWSKIDSWAIGVILVDMIAHFLVMGGFAAKYEPIRGLLEPVLRDMCQINPIHRIDCVQALYRIDPNHFIIRKYGTRWLEALPTPDRK